jgi:cadmium resistance protein CadD (predicted permease)
MDWLPLVLLGMTAFAATNVDDSLLLVLFFSDRRYRIRHVFAGQALGIGLLVSISLAVALLALAVPTSWVGLLGFLPIALGVRELIGRWRGSREDQILPETAVSGDAPGWRRAAAVAGVTLASGGDNIGVYAPLFAARPPTETAVLLVVFGVMLAIWLFGALYLARRSAVAGSVQRVGRAIFPFALIMIGLVIIIEHL